MSDPKAHQRTNEMSGTGTNFGMAHRTTWKTVRQQFKSALFGMMLGIVIPALAMGQTATLLPNAKQQYVDDAGNPVASGQVFYYVPGQTTKKTVWQDSAETTPAPNPVQLDAAGRPVPTGQTFGEGVYRQKVVDQNNITVWDAVTTSTSGTSGGGGTASTQGVMVGTVLPWVNSTLPPLYLYAAGQAVSRTTFAQLMSAITFSTTILCQVGIATITVSTDISDKMPIGGTIEASCFAPGTVVLSKGTGTLTMDHNASTTISVAAVLFPWGDGDRATTFNVPDMRGNTVVGRCNMLSVSCSNTIITYYGSNPNAQGAYGGNQSTTLATVNLPPYTPTGTVPIVDPGHVHVETGSPAGGASNHMLAPNAGTSGATANSLDNTVSATTGITASFVGAPQTGTSTPFSRVQPSVTADYIVKALPDDAPTGPGVTSIGGMTGVIACGTGITCNANTISATALANVPHTQDFLTGVGFTPGVSTSITLSSAPAATDLVSVTFDGVGQNANTWSLVGSVITFNAVIPLNTQVVEAKWSTSATQSVAGVSSITASPSTLTGAVTLVAGSGVTLTPAGQNITVASSGTNILGGPTTSVTFGGGNTTIGNNLSWVSVMDTAYGARCNAIIVSSSATYSISSGNNVLTGTGASVGFAVGDIGKSIWVPGAGAAGAGLSTTIASFNSATSVNLTINASTTILNRPVTQGDPLVYGTDDTASINAAIAGTPAFGTLYINPAATFPVLGCLIKQSGATGRSLLIDHPINITGGGNSSALITDPSMGSTIINIHALVSGVTWKGITWEGFLLGTNTNFTPMTRYGSYGIWFDATTAGPAGFQGIHVRNLSIGESFSGFYSLVLDGIGSQGNRIEDNFIYGGVFLNATADSNMLLNNRFLGLSTFGVRIDTPAAGNTIYTGNSTTLAAGVCILNGSGTIVANNFFEEGTASVQYPHNAFLDVGCSSGQSMSSTQVYGNIILTGSSLTSTPIKIDANAGFTTIYGNEIATSTVRAGINNSNATTTCGPNQWISASPHLSGTAPILWGVGAC